MVFVQNTALLNYIEDSDQNAKRWKKLDARIILFWYRQSPRPFIWTSDDLAPGNPPLQHAGQALILLDAAAALMHSFI